LSLNPITTDRRKTNWFGHGVLKNNSSTFKDLQTQIQGLSKTMSVFKDFPGLENLEKKFKDFQGPARALRTRSD